MGRDPLQRVLVRGPSVMQGYFGAPAAGASAGTFLPGGWLDTGDVVENP